jgi:hypothetical protein
MDLSIRVYDDIYFSQSKFFTYNLLQKKRNSDGMTKARS